MLESDSHAFVSAPLVLSSIKEILGVSFHSVPLEGLGFVPLTLQKTYQQPLKVAAGLRVNVFLQVSPRKL